MSSFIMDKSEEVTRELADLMQNDTDADQEQYLTNTPVAENVKSNVYFHPETATSNNNNVNDATRNVHLTFSDCYNNYGNSSNPELLSAKLDHNSRPGTTTDEKKSKKRKAVVDCDKTCYRTLDKCERILDRTEPSPSNPRKVKKRSKKNKVLKKEGDNKGTKLSRKRETVRKKCSGVKKKKHNLGKHALSCSLKTLFPPGNPSSSKCLEVEEMCPILTLEDSNFVSRSTTTSFNKASPESTPCTTSALLSMISNVVNTPKYSCPSVNTTSNEMAKCEDVLTKESPSHSLLRSMIAVPHQESFCIGSSPRQALSKISRDKEMSTEKISAKLTSKLEKEITCDCQLNKGMPCCLLFDEEKLKKARLIHLQMKRETLDLVILAKIAAHINSDSKTKKNKNIQRDRKRSRLCFYHEGKQICHKTFLFIHGICKGRLAALVKHFKENGLSSRVHGNTDSIPSHALSFEDSERVLNFIRTYAADHCVSSFGHKDSSKADSSLLVMSPSQSKFHVHHEYKLWCLEQNVRSVSLRSFQSLWNHHLSHIIVLRGSNKISFPQDNCTETLKAVYCDNDLKNPISHNRYVRHGVTENQHCGKKYRNWKVANLATFSSNSEKHNKTDSRTVHAISSNPHEIKSTGTKERKNKILKSMPNHGLTNDSQNFKNHSILPHHAVTPVVIPVSAMHNSNGSAPFTPTDTFSQISDQQRSALMHAMDQNTTSTHSSHFDAVKLHKTTSSYNSSIVSDGFERLIKSFTSETEAHSVSGHKSHFANKSHSAASMKPGPNFSIQSQFCNESEMVNSFAVNPVSMCHEVFDQSQLVLVPSVNPQMSSSVHHENWGTW